LAKWDLVRKRGRQKLHSPDPQYDPKVQAVQQARQQAQAQPAEHVLVYGDEKTVYRWPPPGQAYEAAGSGGMHQPTAPKGTHSNTKHRWAGLLNAVTGQVLLREGAKAGKDLLVKLLEDLRQAYPDQQVSLAWDNWPVHKNPEILAAAERLKIRLLWLPTYAPWTNPIEKLWGWLQEEILILHRHSEEFDVLLDRCRDFFQRLAQSAQELLRYVGLAPD
jgi:transposase